MNRSGRNQLLLGPDFHRHGACRGNRPDFDPDGFLSMPLAGYDQLPDDGKKPADADATKSFMSRRFGFGGR